MAWEKYPGGNYVLDVKGKTKAFISYQPNTGQFMGVAVGLLAGDTINETALVIPEDVKEYRILNGDWRKQYEPLAKKGLKACIAFYNSKKKEFGSSWSS